VNYARALTLMEEWRTAPALMMAANRSPLAERVVRLLGWDGTAGRIRVAGWRAVSFVWWKRCWRATPSWESRMLPLGAGASPKQEQGSSSVIVSGRSLALAKERTAQAAKAVGNGRGEGADEQGQGSADGQ